MRLHISTADAQSLAQCLEALFIYQRTPRRRNIRSDSRPPFSLWTEIAVRTTTDTRRLSDAQPRVIVARKSLKSTGQHPRRPATFTDFSFAVHQYRPGFGAETSFFTHQLKFMPNLQARHHASGSARQRRVRPKWSGLQTIPCSLTNGLSQPRSRLLRTQTLLMEGKRENGCER